MNKLIRRQVLPISMEKAWDFFATPANLNVITPKELSINITSELTSKMYEGQIITYRIKPMLNIPINWVTEISHIREGSYFVDNQIKGPYKTWHHEHHFEKTEEGVLMTDILFYDIGKSFVGWMAGKLFVHKKVEEIFNYRFMALEKYFNEEGKLN